MPKSQNENKTSVPTLQSSNALFVGERIQGRDQVHLPFRTCSEMRSLESGGRKIARALFKAERAPQIELGENDKYLRAHDVALPKQANRNSTGGGARD